MTVFLRRENGSMMRVAGPADLARLNVDEGVLVVKGVLADVDTRWLIPLGAWVARGGKVDRR